jgi:predicted TIM-barrel fold metal-dependent hydrolase
MSASPSHPVVDADTHVYETDVTWSYLADSEKHFKPLTLTANEVPEGMRARIKGNVRYWFMGGTLHFRPEGHIDHFAGEGTLEMRNMQARLADMDRMGIDVQVIFSTMFLLMVLPDPERQMAMARAYNRWIADCCSADPKRLRWVALIEPRMVEASCAELRRAKAAGAVGVMIRALRASTRSTPRPTNSTCRSACMPATAARASARSASVATLGRTSSAARASARSPPAAGWSAACPSASRSCGSRSSRPPRSGCRSR